MNSALALAIFVRAKVEDLVHEIAAAKSALAAYGRALQTFQ